MLPDADVPVIPAQGSYLTAIRLHLQARRDELHDRLRRLEVDRRHWQTPLPQGFSDQAVARENDEVLDRLAESTATELAQTVHALERLNRGLYGDCERCGQQIDAHRLRALPTTTHCRDCAVAGSIG